MTSPTSWGAADRRRSLPPRALAGPGDRRQPARLANAGPPGRSRWTPEREHHSFDAVDALLPNPFPPGTDPTRIGLPPVPRPHSQEDDEVHHRRYWQAHVWKILLRYRRAYAQPACTDRLRTGYREVDEVAVRLAERVTSGSPLAPADAGSCQSALHELEARATALESSVAALAAGSDPLGQDPTPQASVASVAAAALPKQRAAVDVPAESMAPDLFVSSPTGPWYLFRPGRRTRGGRRHGRGAAVPSPTIEATGNR